MSEEPKSRPLSAAPRTIPEIDQEYGNLCSQIGHKLFQIRNLDIEVRAHQDRLLHLQKESNDRAILDQKLAQIQAEAKKETPPKKESA